MPWLRVKSSAALTGSLQVPASKYHEHRALILGAVSKTPSVIHGRSYCRHVQFTTQALKAIGTRIEVRNDGYTVDPDILKTPKKPVFMGSSGTTMYMLLGLLSRCQGGPVTVTGMRYFNRRPIGALLQGLRDLGISAHAKSDVPPITLKTGSFRGGEVSMPGFLSQWVSGMLLVSTFADDDVTIRVIPPHNEMPYIDLTIAMMKQFGVNVQTEADGNTYKILAGQTYQGQEVDLPSDYSSLAFLLAAGALVPGSDLTLYGHFNDDHPERDIVEILLAMGADLNVSPDGSQMRIRNGRRLQAFELDLTNTPDLLPILSVLASQADGVTVLKNVEHIRYKECDRVKAMTQLVKMGVKLEDRGSELVITGGARLNGAVISTYNDHRVHMSFTIAGMLANGDTYLSYPHAYRLSYPSFLDDITALGAQVYLVEEKTPVGCLMEQVI